MSFGVDGECTLRLAVAAEKVCAILFSSVEFTHEMLTTLTIIMNEIVVAAIKNLHHETEAACMESDICILLLIRALLVQLGNEIKTIYHINLE